MPSSLLWLSSLPLCPKTPLHYEIIAGILSSHHPAWPGDSERVVHRIKASSAEEGVASG